MPILCPKSSLWRFGRHGRRGGRKTKAIKSSTPTRRVNTRGTGTPTHPFITKQVNPAPVTMSPGSTGGVYLGPTKAERKPALSASSQERKLAEIRAPTQYYTDGPAVIDQDEATAQQMEEDVQQETRPAQSRQLSAAPESRYNDTLNPDGANASIVFFEETFMSRFSHLTTNSPQCATRSIVIAPHSPKGIGARKETQHTTLLSPRRSAAGSGVPRSPEVAEARTNAHNSAPLTPSKRTREDMDSDHEDDVTEIAALLTPSKQPALFSRGSNRKHRNVIPSWVRQKRYLPTIDDVDFDMIDLISLHSLTPNESRVSVFSTSQGNEENGDSSPLRDALMNNNNYHTPPKNMKSNSQAIGRNKDHPMKGKQARDKRETRSVLGDLTNTPGSQGKHGKGMIRSDKTRVSLKIAKRSTAGDRRSRRNRQSGPRTPRSSSREDLISAMDKVGQHDYVNLEHIARVITESPPSRDTSTEDDDDNDYVTLLMKSPAKVAKITKSALSPGKDSLKGARKESVAKTVTFTDGPQESSQLGGKMRRRSERIHLKNTKLATLSEDSDLDKPDECVPWTEERCKPASSIRRSLPVASTSLTVREGTQNEIHARKVLFGVPSQGARSKNNLIPENKTSAINSAGTNREDTLSIHQMNPAPSNLTVDHNGKSEKSPYTSLSENDSLLYDDVSVLNRPKNGSSQSHQTISSVQHRQTIGSLHSRQMNHLHAKQEPKCLIEKPSFTDNTFRKARIVRTNSMEDGQRTLPRKTKTDKETGERKATTDRQNNQIGREEMGRQDTQNVSTLDRNNRRDRGAPGRQGTLERRKQRSSEESSQSTISKPNVADKTRVFTPRKSTHVETRRSLPAPASAKVISAQMTPQRHSTTNVRTMEAKLSKSQNRKIRRTVEDDEIMEAMTGQNEAKSISTNNLEGDQFENHRRGRGEGKPSAIGDTTSKNHEGDHSKNHDNGRVLIDNGAKNPVAENIPSRNLEGQMYEIRGHGKKIVLGLGESPERDAATRVQKIINDWNQSSKRIVSAHRSTHYVGTHVHAIPNHNARTDGPITRNSNSLKSGQSTLTYPNARKDGPAVQNANSRKSGQGASDSNARKDGRTISNSHKDGTVQRSSHDDRRADAENFSNHEPIAKKLQPGVYPLKNSGRANRENIATRSRSVQPTGSGDARREVGANSVEASQHSVEVSHSAIRRIPTVASNANVTTSRRSVNTPSVIEIYIASQPYVSNEVDEIDVQEGEILVVNSSMQRESDWMWIYAPRSDRFGYIPGFAARPMEFQQSQI